MPVNIGAWIRIFSKPEELDELEKSLGYRFRDRARLENALVHPSYRFEHQSVKADNQRLEFLGDAVLGLLAADHLYKNCDEIDEGRLTVMRSQVASGKALSAIAADIGIDKYLRLGKGESRSGGRTRPGNLEDALEAIFGAAWEDGGLRAATRIFDHLIRPRLLTVDQERVGGESIWAGNPKGHLQSVVQTRFKCNVRYTLLSTGGTGHAPTFEVEARVDRENGPAATAVGPSKRKAEAEAATRLLEFLETYDGEPSDNAPNAEVPPPHDDAQS